MDFNLVRVTLLASKHFDKQGKVDMVYYDRFHKGGLDVIDELHVVQDDGTGFSVLSNQVQAVTPEEYDGHIAEWAYEGNECPGCGNLQEHHIDCPERPSKKRRAT